MKAVALFHSRGPQAALDVLDGIRSNDDVVLRITRIARARAAALVLLDRLDEAKLEVRKLREHDPTWTLEKHSRRFFYVDSEELKMVRRALALAGLPER